MVEHFITTVLIVFLIHATCFHLFTAKSVPIDDRHRSKQYLGSTLAESVQIDEAMTHLKELERIAMANNGNRAAGTTGFNQTLDYLVKYLSTHTNFKITKTDFHVRDSKLKYDPVLLSSIDGTITNHTYSKDYSEAEFFRVRYSKSANFSSFIPVTVIPNSGCFEADWIQANPPISGHVALVKRGACTFIEQSTLAAKFNGAALLLYNDGTSPNHMLPMVVDMAQSYAIPALSLSYDLGERLANAARNPWKMVGVRITNILLNEESFAVGNICVDTPTGDPTQTIVVGSHSDSVYSGPGINDDGSGSAANLAWTVALARLFQTSTYAKYKYRLRFCWWGAEENGILGSKYHVAHAKQSTVVGERLIDYVAYLNFDMIGSTNFQFATYDGRTANNDTLPSAIVGSYKISQAFRDWFIQQNLPWDFVEFGYGSDYAPFLIEGVPVGGLYSGSDDIRTQEECDRYNQLLGPDHCTVANVEHDPCYHEDCDTVENINVFAYDKMIKAAASTIENLARQPDLKSWLYSST
ncbi:unnamed protein product [Rotaria socialis]|uniref:Peptide hydrolase n=1 Tax=Rotaria socialis TaxID=392032 RepID=A0A818QHF5_9BILA|nr:unnamed protein product [Rotaria socialis]CAF4582849.1 unnamed protein product [Rotaria socialis]